MIPVEPSLRSHVHRMNIYRRYAGACLMSMYNDVQGVRCMGVRRAGVELLPLPEDLLGRRKLGSTVQRRRVRIKIILLAGSIERSHRNCKQQESSSHLLKYREILRDSRRFPVACTGPWASGDTCKRLFMPVTCEWTPPRAGE